MTDFGTTPRGGRELIAQQAKEIEALKRQCHWYEHLLEICNPDGYAQEKIEEYEQQAKRIEELTELHRRNLRDFRRKRPHEHMCPWRVVAEGMAERSKAALNQGEHDNGCYRCGGSGYESAAKKMGMDDMPAMLRPIGMWPCGACNGTGQEIDIDKLAEELKALLPAPPKESE